MRARIALVCGIAALGAAVPAASSTAGEAMHHCANKPHVEGFSFQYLNERGLGCEHARHLAAHVVRHGAPEHYKCTYRLGPPDGRFVHWHCAHKDNHHGVPVRAFGAGYVVQ